MTPHRDRKIYDNPYLNGSKSTPGNDDEEHGEESDDMDISDGDDEYDDDIIEAPHFTIKGDESDEEKDDINNDNNKDNDKNKDQKQPIIDDQNIPQNPVK